MPERPSSKAPNTIRNTAKELVRDIRNLIIYVVIPVGLSLPQLVLSYSHAYPEKYNRNNIMWNEPEGTTFERQHAIEYLCTGEARTLSEEEDGDFLKRVQEQRAIVDAHLEALGIPATIHLDPTDIFYCQIPAKNACNETLGVQARHIRVDNRSALAVDTKFSPEENNGQHTIPNSMLKHEITHSAQQIGPLLWLKEAGADVIAEIQSPPEKKYWINRIWWNFLAAQIEAKGINESGEYFLLQQVHNKNTQVAFDEDLLEELLSDLKITEEEREFVIKMLLKESSSSLWVDTAVLLQKNQSFWEEVLGISYEVFSKAYETKPCTQKVAKREEDRIQKEKMAGFMAIGALTWLLGWARLDSKKRRRRKKRL